MCSIDHEMPRFRCRRGKANGGFTHHLERFVRYVYIGLVVVFAALVLLFVAQNFQTATVALFSASITLPIALLVIAVYVLGMATGGFALALLRGVVGRARRRG